MTSLDTPSAPRNSASTSLNLNPSIFREYDIRGIAGRDLSAEFARRLGFAYGIFIARQLKKPLAGMRISVGRDCRLSSPELAGALAEGITGTGADVVDLGLASTDLVYFAAGSLDVPAIMLTASHNPPKYNGYKAYWNDGSQVTPPHDAGIIERVNAVEKVKLMDKDEALKKGLLAIIDKEVRIGNDARVGVGELPGAGLGNDDHLGAGSAVGGEVLARGHLRAVEGHERRREGG